MAWYDFLVKGAKDIFLPFGGGDKVESFFGGLTGQGTEFDNKNFDAQQMWTQKMFDRDQQWRNEDREYNTPAAQADRMRAAGIHPMAALGGGMGSGGAGNMTGAMVGSGNRIPTPVQDSGDRLDPVAMIGLFNQARNDRAYRALMGAQTRNLNADAAKKEYYNERQDEIYDREVMGWITNNKEALSRIDLNEEDAKKIAQDTELSLYKVYEIAQQIRLISETKEYWAAHGFNPDQGWLSDIAKTVGIPMLKIIDTIKAWVNRMRGKEK
jgi:hypothetical protein